MITDSCEICGYLTKKFKNGRCEQHQGKTLIGTCFGCKWYLRAGISRRMNEGIAFVCWNPIMKDKCANFDDDDGCNKWEGKP
jgi:hypothetical protein